MVPTANEVIRVNKAELIEKLKQTDEVTLLELLEIHSDELIDAFMEKIEDKLPYLYDQLS